MRRTEDQYDGTLLDEALPILPQTESDMKQEGDDTQTDNST